MKYKDRLSDMLGEIDEKYIDELCDIREKRAKRRKTARRIWSVAACFAMFTVIAIVVIIQITKQPPVNMPVDTGTPTETYDSIISPSHKKEDKETVTNETTVQGQSEPIEVPDVEVPTEMQSRTYYCTADYYREWFAKDWEYIPALTLNDDGTMMFRVFYIGGVADVPGTYEIDGNKIYIYCRLDESFFKGSDPYGFPYMDDKFMFEVVDEDTLIFFGHPDDTNDVRAYTLEQGYVFKSEILHVNAEDDYTGTWSSEGKHGSITITAVGEDYILFNGGIEKQFKFTVKAVKLDDIYVFGTDTSPILYGPTWVKGSVKLEPDAVSITYADLPHPWEGLNSELKYYDKSPLELQPHTKLLESAEPCQSHVGEWRYKVNDNGKTFEVLNVKLSIHAVDPESITFTYEVKNDLVLEAVAVKADGRYIFGKDISPSFKLNHHDPEKLESYNNISGRLEFFAKSVSFTITDENGDTSSVKYTEKYEISTNMSELPESTVNAISETWSTLEEKGWEKVQCINSEPDSLRRWKVKVPMYDPRYSTVLYTLIASRDGIDIGVRIVFNEHTEVWEAVGVYYVNSHGTMLIDRTYTTFVEDTGKTDFILSATDPDLIDYFR